MKQTFKLFVAIIMVSAFYVIEINADSTVNKELKELKKEYTQLEKEYNKLIKQGAPSAVIQRKGEELGKLSEVIGKFENGGNTNHTPISNTDISKEDIVLTQNIDAVTDPGTDASSQNNSQPKKSNTNEEISLTVSSDGATKDDALKNALRTAIEQAYGAFVSANTTILNDELVKDEIVTVSNGSIKDYKEISSFEKPDGSGYMITVNATVSLPHLITYAKNHGSECEFAGNTFGMELKLFNLQKENELEALYNMIPVVEELCKTTMHWELEMRDPIIPDIKVEYGDIKFYGTRTNPFRYDFSQDFVEKEILENLKESPKGYCAVEFNVKYLRNGDENEVLKYIYSTLSEISIPHEVWLKYGDMGLEPSCCGWAWGFHNEVYRYFYGKDPWKYDIHFNLRNKQEDIDKWVADLQDRINHVRFNFVISDNSGNVSDGDFYTLNKFWNADYIEKEQYVVDKDYYRIPDGITKLYNCVYGFGGKGLFNGLFFIEFGNAPLENEVSDQYRRRRELINRIVVILPIAEISKYSSFKIVSKEQ